MSVVALDLDGTLLTCAERQTALALHLAPDLDGARFWAAKRNGATTAAAFAAQGFNPELADRWVAAIEHPAWLAHDRVAPHVEEALTRLREKGHRAVVLTARRDEHAVRAQVADHLAVDDVLVVSPTDAAWEKSERLRELGALGLIGDTESDARAAALARVRFAGLSTGQRSPAFLLRHGVRPVYDDIVTAVGAILAA